ncbi:DUF6458 family protein [uncultured Nocardioides sp.]|jgi:uncharacterized protein YacL|uniref:DUF6458 family protein n=1 Tax=uncultured Nocardioides sp. TaxID=198441 RepID=UPI000C4D68B6|nr:DUF6458 family protein [uncultured Nocardioides sp.]MAY96898.1 hypothetical protein [Nocardioides sp.]MCK5929002.1 hypothetical protein [Nocardioides sp.]|tara:strand:+ start:460 stop:699 length:240 start_codon:yes stop_codon:yes gene_type:complete
MGYGAGGFLVVVGLILALAVQDAVEGVDLQMIGWIMTIVGVAILVLTAVTLNNRRGAGSVQTTTHADGSVTERRTSHDV